MAAPVDAARTTTSISTAGTTHTINTGTPANGDLALVFGRFAAAPGTVTFTGYTAMPDTPNTTDLSDDTSLCWWRQCNGTEGATDTASTVNSVKGAFIYYRITGAQNPATTPPTDESANTGTSANAQASSLSSLTLADYLFVLWAGCDGELITFTAASGYSNVVNANSGVTGASATNCCVGSCTKQVLATTNEFPGAFTNGAPSTGYTAWLIAVPAAPSAVDRGRGFDTAVYNAEAISRSLRRVR